MNIEIVSSSTRKESLTFRLALYLKKLLSESTRHSIGLIDVREYALPPLEKVYVNIDATPEQFKPLARQIFAANAFIIVTPEYNGSYSSAMKNMFDHFPKQLHKAFGVVTGSPGAMGGMRATQQVQLLINALFGIASPYMLVMPFLDQKFDTKGNLTDKSLQGNIDTFVHEFLWLAEKLCPEKEVK